MALSNARMKAMVDTELALASHDYIGFSANGTGETASLARLAKSEVGGWSTPTAADPYEPANVSAGESAAASADVTISHWATFSLATDGVQGTIWIPVTGTNPALVTGGKLSIAAGALKPLIADRITVP